MDSDETKAGQNPGDQPTLPADYEDPQARKLGSNILLVRGVLALAIGIVAVVWPDITVKIFAVLMGILLIISGVLVVVEAFDRKDLGSAWIGQLLAGLFLGGFGVAAVVWPGPTVRALALLFGVALIISGVMICIEAASSFREDSGWPLYMIWGLLAIGFGIVMVSWPEITIGVIVILKGVFWILGGAINLITSRQVRKGAYLV